MFAAFRSCFQTLIPCSSDGTVLESCLSLLGEHDCVISRIFDNTKNLTPHLGCTIIDGAEMDEGLLWSEVLSAVSLMARRLLKKEFHLNELAPVRTYKHLCRSTADPTRSLLSHSLVRKHEYSKPTLILVCSYKNPTSSISVRKTMMASRISYAG